MKSNGYYRSKVRNEKLKRLEKQRSYFVNREDWRDPESRLIRFYLSSRRGFAKEQTNKAVRRTHTVSDHSGYRKLFDYFGTVF